MACAAALANLEIFKKEKTLQKLQVKIRFLKQSLNRFWELPHVGDIRQMGFMVGIELVQNRGEKQPFPEKYRMGHRVVLAARRQGVILRPLGDTIVLMPPLSISLGQLKKLVDITYNSIGMVGQGK